METHRKVGSLQIIRWHWIFLRLLSISILNWVVIVRMITLMRFSLNMFWLQLPQKLEHYKKLWEERCNLCPLESCKSPFLHSHKDGVKWSNIKKHKYVLKLGEITKIVLLGPFLICQVLLKRCQMSEAETRIPSEKRDMSCLQFISHVCWGRPLKKEQKIGYKDTALPPNWYMLEQSLSWHTFLSESDLCVYTSTKIC